MKKIKYLLCIIITFSFGISVVFGASSNFDTAISMEPDITENQIKLVLGFTGEEAMIVNQTLSYDNTYLKLLDVVAMDNFNVTTSKEKKDGKYNTIKILADSDYSFNASNYCIVIFEVNSKFKPRKKSDVFLYNVEATGPDKEKYRVKGDIITMDRESMSVMNMIDERIDDSTKIKYWFINHAILLVIIALLIVGAIVAFVLFFPSKRKEEKRDKEVSEQIKSDNYNPNNISQFDVKAVDKIGAVEKNVDMTEAIIYDENVKPFGEIVGKNEENTSIQQNTDINPNMNASVFDNRTPDTPIVAEGNLISVNMPVENNQMEQSTQVNQVPPTNNITETNNFDPFNAKAELSIPSLDANVDNIETLEELPKLADENVSSQKEGLIAINTQAIESAEPISVESMPEFPINNENNQTDNNNNQNNNTNNNSTNFMILVILFVLSSFCLMSSVKASEQVYRVSELRDLIVGKYPYNKELDYNGDGKIDIMDLVTTKNLVNCNFENLMNTDPGFAELHGHSNNLISVDPNRPTTTKKGKKTTTKKEKTTKDQKTTTQKDNNSNTTTKKVNKETTKKTTTKKSTTVKTEAPIYNITIKANNGSVNPTNISLSKNKSTSITLVANEGYTINKENISCNNVSFSLSSSTKLVLSDPTDNASCTINFIGSSKIKATLKYVLGKGSSKSGTSVTYGSYSSKTYTGALGSMWIYRFDNISGYKVANGYPTCGTYVNGSFTFVIPTTSSICELKFEPILYSININGGSPLTASDSQIYFNESKKIYYTSTTKYRKVICGGKMISVSNSRQSDGTFKGSFTYKHVATSNVSCTLMT